MGFSENSLQNNTLASLLSSAPKNIAQAIQKASAKTGVDFAYLLEKAAAESSFNPAAKAKTSSATGLFQFIESTWMNMVKNHGDKYGLGDLAEKIDSRGRVSDRETRKEILELRKDPEIASYMAAELASENRDYLERHVGGEIGSTEMYFAHFMGAGGAAAFLREMNHNPMATAADLFPKAAMANRGVFYDSATGQPRTLQQVYNFFDKKFGDDESLTPQMVASALSGKGGAETIIPPQKPNNMDSNTESATRTAGRYYPAARFDAPVYIAPMRTTQSLAAMLSQDQVPRISQNTNSLATRNIFPSSFYGQLSAADLLYLSADKS